MLRGSMTPPTTPGFPRAHNLVSSLLLVGLKRIMMSPRLPVLYLVSLNREKLREPRFLTGT